MDRSDAAVLERLFSLQENEITEYAIYSRLAASGSDLHNRQVLEAIAAEERRHAAVWQGYTGKEVPPDRVRVALYSLLARLFGLTFTLKLMENGEKRAQRLYADLEPVIPKTRSIREEEEAHERSLLALLDEERLRYAGSVVLGLNDALVELTGTLAGLSFALQNTRIIAVAGLITGVAASFSMAASAYLSEKADEGSREPLRASFYTGSAYVATVVLLVLPFLLVASYVLALLMTIVIALGIITIFTFYLSVAKDLSFKRRFAEMAAISIGVAALSFVVGLLIRSVLGIEL
ncbi:MAG: rubrerythrin family protein [Methanomicrobiales archaeon]|nr:rubrerythrin family protein [Methanomicrobiales archaeon]